MGLNSEVVLILSGLNSEILLYILKRLEQGFWENQMYSQFTLSFCEIITMFPYQP